MTGHVVDVGTVPPIQCAPWCEYGDGHPEEFCREDQTCWSPAAYVDLSQMPVHHEESGDYPEQLGVMARRDHQRTVVYLHLQGIKIHGPIPWPYNHLDHALHLTPDEAEGLARLLLDGAKMVRETPAPER